MAPQRRVPSNQMVVLSEKRLIPARANPQFGPKGPVHDDRLFEHLRRLREGVLCLHELLADVIERVGEKVSFFEERAVLTAQIHQRQVEALGQMARLILDDAEQRLFHRLHQVGTTQFVGILVQWKHICS